MRGSLNDDGGTRVSRSYELWHGTGTRSLRVLWTLEELDAADAVVVHPTRFPARLHQPDYVDVNPLGSLPYFRDGAVGISESMAACQYLAAGHAPTPLAVLPDERGFAEYLQFCWFGEATLMPPVGTLVVNQLVATPADRSQTAIDHARSLLQHRQGAIARAIEGREYLAADRFTLADVSVGYALGLAKALGADDLFAPSVADYLDRLIARPAYRRATAS